MINLIDVEESRPYKIFKKLYDEAHKNKQVNIEACCISSFNSDLNKVSSRFVNIKYIKDNKFYFFSNYSSPKAKDFVTHKQISCIFFWPAISSQIRINAEIFYAASDESDKHFKNRVPEKNALAISSQQSEKISSYSDVERDFLKVLNSGNLLERPEYWGGYYFIPNSFEFWRGHKNRLNKRELFTRDNNDWSKSILQP